MLCHIYHLRAKYTDGTVYSGKSLIETSHHSTYALTLFYKHYFKTTIGTVKGCLHSCHTTAYNKHSFVYLEGRRIERSILHDLCNRHPYYIYGFFCI